MGADQFGDRERAMNMPSLHVSPVDGVGKSTGGKYATSRRGALTSMGDAVSTVRVRAHPSVTTRTAFLMFFFSALGSACSGAEAVGGPIHRGDCGLPPIKWEESWGEFFNRIPANAEKSGSLESLSLKGLGFYSWQTNYQLPTTRLMPNGPQVPFFPAHDEYKPSFDWRCKRYIILGPSA
jgi:hypothetical protein